MGHSAHSAVPQTGQGTDLRCTWRCTVECALTSYAAVRYKKPAAFMRIVGFCTFTLLLGILLGLRPARHRVFGLFCATPRAGAGILGRRGFHY